MQAAEKVGGSFKLVSLIQRRLREIVKSGTKPAGYDIDKLQDLILDEILEGSLQLELEEKKEKAT
jgi:hypothetical protein